MRDQTLLVGDDHWEGLHLMVFWGFFTVRESNAFPKICLPKNPPISEPQIGFREMMGNLAAHFRPVSGW